MRSRSEDCRPPVLSEQGACFMIDCHMDATSPRKPHSMEVVAPCIYPLTVLPARAGVAPRMRQTRARAAPCSDRIRAKGGRSGRANTHCHPRPLRPLTRGGPSREGGAPATYAPLPQDHSICPVRQRQQTKTLQRGRVPLDPMPAWVLTRRRQIGERIRAARERADLTQIELGQRIGRDHRTIHRWEYAYRVPTLEDLLLLADAADVPLAELVR